MIHALGYSHFLEIKEITHSAFVVGGLIQSLTVIGINGFIFITGYYLSTKGTASNIRKIISFIFEVIFISAFVFLMISALSRNFDVKVLIKSILPFLTQFYWYPINYLMLMCISPFLNVFVEKTTKRQLGEFIVLCAVLMFGYLKIDICYQSSMFLGHKSHSILWWIFLYFSAAYYRKYEVKHKIVAGPVLFVGCVLVGFAIITVQRLNPVLVERMELLDDDSVLGWLATCSSFITFHQLKWKCNERLSHIFKYVVPATFVVYLFQEHELVRNALWNTVNISQYATASGFRLIVALIAVFALLWLVSVIIYMAYLVARRMCLDRLCFSIQASLEKNIAWLEGKKEDTNG